MRTVGDLNFLRRRRWRKGRCPFCGHKNWFVNTSYVPSTSIIRCGNIQCNAVITTTVLTTYCGTNASLITREPGLWK